MWVRTGSVTLGVTPWACCARYVRYTRTGFPPQTRPPSRSSPHGAGEPDESVKGRNSGVISRVGETGCRYHWSQGGTGWAWRQLRAVGPTAPSPLLPFAAARPRLHSYSPPFDLHVGSNCGGGGARCAAAQLRLQPALDACLPTRHHPARHKCKCKHKCKHKYKRKNKHKYRHK